MAKLFSMIPLTSPIVMVVRAPFGVPFGELALSFGLLVLMFVLMVWLSSRIYRIGILSYGKKPTWKDLWKWLR
jgi:ABC-2 type transport system permease protein